MGFAFDSATGDAVLCGGGKGSGVLDGTWTWDGTNWTEQFPSTSPGGLCGPSTAYDAARGKIVLFGGYDANYVPVADTWTWNGKSWRMR